MKKMRVTSSARGTEAGLPGPTERFLAVCIETFPQLEWLDRFYHGGRPQARKPCKINYLAPGRTVLTNAF